MRRQSVCLLIVATALAVGCGRNPLQRLSEPQSRAATDSGVVLRTDVGLPDDGGSADVGPEDTGPPPADLRLATEQRCGLDEDAIVAAAVRHVACTDNPRATIVASLEAAEAFLWGHIDPGTANFTSVPWGCDYWRCVEQIDSCEAYPRCADLVTFGVGAFVCDGSVLTTLNQVGRGLEALDCAAFGAECRGERCVIGDCEFGGRFFSNQLRCSGDRERLVVCPGTVEMECDAWSNGSSCADFYVGGEPPVAWCSPTGESFAGAYDREVECRRGIVEFETEWGRSYRIDCRALGYSACNQRGCVR